VVAPSGPEGGKGIGSAEMRDSGAAN
jgi:hypothetical protein